MHDITDGWQPIHRIHTKAYANEKKDDASNAYNILLCSYSTKNEILFLSNKLCHATTAATDAIAVVVWYKNVKWFVVEGCKLVEQG